MDFDIAIERYCGQLLAIVAMLFSKIRLADGGSVERLTWPTYRAVLAILRPAESAVRRLIVIAARDLVIKASTSRPFPKGRIISGKGGGNPCFQLFDPPMHEVNVVSFRRSGPVSVPRIRSLGDDFGPLIPAFLRTAPTLPPEPEPARGDTVNAERLCRRLAAIQQALKNLTGQAKRYARIKSKAEAERRPALRALRLLPPGLNRKSSHEVHEILRECQWLARHLPATNTS